MTERAPRSKGLPAASALLAALALQAGCAAGGPARSDPPAVPVTVGEVARKDVPVLVEQIGTVEAYSTVEIKAQVGGVLQAVHFKEGQDVRAGDLLFTIDPRPYDAALKRARAELDKDTVQLKTARQDAERYSDLVKKDYVTQEEYERIRTSAASLEADVAADAAAVENATVALEYCTIRSPIDGRTGKLMVHQGNLVKANDDTPLIVINQVDPIYAAFSVPEQTLPEIKARKQSGRLEVEARSPGAATEPLVGWLSFIDNAIDRTTGTVLLKATFPNPQRILWPGQFVNVRLKLSTRTGVLVIPAQAVQTGQQGSFVFVVRPDFTVESRPVVAGATIGQETLVEKGLQAGERVVIDGQIRLVPGTRIEAKNGA
jgi:membrane fusion protein, multidrug efflux system